MFEDRNVEKKVAVIINEVYSCEKENRLLFQYKSSTSWSVCSVRFRFVWMNEFQYSFFQSVLGLNRCKMYLWNKNYRNCLCVYPQRVSRCHLFVHYYDICDYVNYQKKNSYNSLGVFPSFVFYGSHCGLLWRKKFWNSGWEFPFVCLFDVFPY